MMTSVLSPRKLGKRAGKQIQDAVASWGSTPTRRDGKLFGGLAPSLGAAHRETFEARHMPKVAARPLRPAFCCFPHASPVLPSGAEKQKTAPKDRSKQLISLRKSGAGEGIRTLDPNLGKVPWADSLASKSVVVLLRLFRQPKGAIEIILPLPCLQPAFGFKPFEVGQVSR